MKSYQHRQTGYLFIVLLSSAILLLLGIMMMQGFSWIGILVMVILALCLIPFSTMSVDIDGGMLVIRFGPGIIRKRILISEIVSCRHVKNPWYIGWGIRIFYKGWLYNVSGYDAVELKLKSGTRIRIGTDEPHELEKAVLQAIEMTAGKK